MGFPSDAGRNNPIRHSLVQIRSWPENKRVFKRFFFTAAKMWEMRGRVSATFLKALWPRFPIYGKNRRMRGRKKKKKMKNELGQICKREKKIFSGKWGETPLQQCICFSSHSPPPPSSSSHCDTARNFPYFKSPKPKAKPSRIPPLFPPKISFDFYSALPPISLGGGNETMGAEKFDRIPFFYFEKCGKRRRNSRNWLLGCLPGHSASFSTLFSARIFFFLL